MAEEPASGRPRRRPSRPGPADVARAAVAEIHSLTGRRPETAIAVERRDEGWMVCVEVVEIHRIPDSADILATYEVLLDPGGRLTSYRRTARYARGNLNGNSK